MLPSYSAIQSMQTFESGKRLTFFMWTALWTRNWKPGRIKSLNLDDVTVEFYNYSDKKEEIIHKKFVRAMQTPDYSSLTKVEVEC